MTRKPQTRVDRAEPQGLCGGETGRDGSGSGRADRGRTAYRPSAGGDPGSTLGFPSSDKRLFLLESKNRFLFGQAPKRKRVLICAGHSRRTRKRERKSARRRPSVSVEAQDKRGRPRFVIANQPAGWCGNPFSFACSPGMTCANQDPFSFWCLPKKKTVLGLQKKKALVGGGEPKGGTGVAACRRTIRGAPAVRSAAARSVPSGFSPHGPCGSALSTRVCGFRVVLSVSEESPRPRRPTPVPVSLRASDRRHWRGNPPAGGRLFPSKRKTNAAAGRNGLPCQ